MRWSVLDNPSTVPGEPYKVLTVLFAACATGAGCAATAETWVPELLTPLIDMVCVLSVWMNSGTEVQHIGRTRQAAGRLITLPCDVHAPYLRNTDEINEYGL